MRYQTTFIASGSATTATVHIGGTVAVANPTAAASAAAVPAGTALLVQNAGNSIASVKFAATASFAPAPMGPGLEDFLLSPGAQLLVQDAGKLAAAFVIVSGSISLTPGSIATTLTVNS